MSYNTRNTRQSAQNAGAGRGTTQIMYHQQQQNQGGSLLRMPNSASSYGGQPQSQQNFSSNQQGAMAGFVPASIPTQPASNVYEYQNQPVATQQVQAPVTPAKSILKNVDTSTAAVKNEAVSPAVTKPDPMVDADNTGETVKKPWLKKKTPGFKINRRLKRRRMNAKLRKMLIPKNAIMVLNELKTGVKFTFHEQANVLAQPMFVVNAEVDGKLHIGQGVSKPLAKQSAAENALKALLLEKMTTSAAVAAAAAAAKPGEEAMETETVAGNGAEDLDDKLDEDDSKLTQEDDVPWGSLASFALYKLFLDWQNQGTHVPISKQVVAPPSAQPLKTAPMKQLPENPTERHPVMLLSQMRPGIKFVEKKREGTAPNLVFTLEVTVEGVSYEGVAKNKKDAKKEAAKAALAGCLGISYENSPFSN